MSNEPSDEQGGGGNWGLWFSVAVVVYLLSPGPVAKFISESKLPFDHPVVESMMIIYYPLGKLADHVKIVEKAYEAYFRLWQIDLLLP